MWLGSRFSEAASLLLPAAALAVTLALPTVAFAGAWTQPRGDSYLRVTYAWLKTESRYDSEGDKVGLEAPGLPVRSTEYRDRELRVYGEYGFADRFTAYGSVIYKSVRILEPLAIDGTRVLPEATHTTNGLGDLYFGARFRILPGRIPVSLASEVKIPGGYSASANPSLGTGKVDVTVRGLVGASAGWIYGTADAGWTYRGGSYQNELLYSGEIGGNLFSRSYSWRGVLRGRRALGTTVQLRDLPYFDPSLASPRMLELSAVLGKELVDGVHIEGGIAHVLSGRNSLAGNSFEVGLAWTRRTHRSL